MSQAKWIWYPGEFEVYHNQLLHMRRYERGVFWPPEWKYDTCYFNVRFRKTVTLEEPETIRVLSTAQGAVIIDSLTPHQFNNLNTDITLPAGTSNIEVRVAKMGGLCSIFVEGKTVVSDETWVTHPGFGEMVPAASNEMYTSPEDNPEVFKFAYEELTPVEIRTENGGVLYDFGKETFAKLIFSEAPDKQRVCYGESLEEALGDCMVYDTVSWVKKGMKRGRFETITNAFRYIFFPGAKPEQLAFTALYEYLPVKRIGAFKSSDELLNQIWEASAYTLELNSREFYIDGLKRDRWVWAGDAYQSCLVNRYLCFDRAIAERTMTALRGKDPVEQYMNRIVDYSLYWVLTVYDHYEMTGDQQFIKKIFPKMKTLIEFYFGRRNADGFVEGKPGDWTFIDWSDMDKTGAVCAEQMLLWRALTIMATCASLVHENDEYYRDAAQVLAEKIRRFYWKDELGAFIDSYQSGKNHVTRHANIFALLYGFANEEERRSIITNVIRNDAITAITTPYFKFFELEAMARLGDIDYLMRNLREYWGGMIHEGSTTIWEGYIPGVPAVEQYAMYGRPFDKSLCHAWGASPVYIMGKYVMGVKPTAPGYATFEIAPHLDGLTYLDATVPVMDGTVHMLLQDGFLTVETTREGATLFLNGKSCKLHKNQPASMRV